MRIIPAIDIIDGKCVRLMQGDYTSQKVYHEDPLEVAKMFEDHGIQHLHLVDLDGAKAGTILNYKVLENLVQKTHLQIDFGGGLKTNEDIRVAFECGVQQITAGSVAVKAPELVQEWLEKYGAEKVVLGADVRNEKIALHGWQETSTVELIPFVKQYYQTGIRYVICTDIGKDGMLEGSSLPLYQKVLEAIPDLLLIASGGVTHMEELFELDALGCEGVIIGKALYENRIGLKELEHYILNRC